MVLDFEGIHFIDSQGAEKMAEILDGGDILGVEVRLFNVKSEVKELLRRDGLVDRIGENRIYSSVFEAVADKI